MPVLLLLVLATQDTQCVPVIGSSVSCGRRKSDAENWSFNRFHLPHSTHHRLTYEMGQRTGFNDRLEDRSKRFTYFVPRDKAWVNSESIYPNALRKLNSPEFDFEVGLGS